MTASFMPGGLESENARLRAELAEHQSIRRIYEAQLDRQALELAEAHAAISRVRDLGERLSRAGYTEYGQDVLRALGRGTE